MHTGITRRVLKNTDVWVPSPKIDSIPFWVSKYFLTSQVILITAIFDNHRSRALLLKMRPGLAASVSPGACQKYRGTAPTLICVWFIWAFVKQILNSACLRWGGLGVFISNKLPGNADATTLGTGLSSKDPAVLKNPPRTSESPGALIQIQILRSTQNLKNQNHRGRVWQSIF